MNWRIKSLAVRLLGSIPLAGHARRFVQRRVTRSYFMPVTDKYLKMYGCHVQPYRRVHPGYALEFGAGENFVSPLLLSNAGCSGVFIYDVARLATVEQINYTIRQLRDLVPGEWPEISDCDSDLLRKYRIDYRAPIDVTRSGLADGEISFVYSTNTLEHIPVAVIRNILAEARRVLAKDAIMSHLIDYQDHYSYGDSSASMFNFYRFSDSEWRLWNPSHHYQNRLRHGDFRNLFAEYGFSELEVTSELASEGAVEMQHLAERFRSYGADDLLTRYAHVVLGTSHAKS
ncbi:MAG TPA: class I SAM-dependent methyltransferase [Rhodanobacteraceae bacterium]|nr:class I SAM-dependent methyltransferase [Rhodanobacteraceae bacterium]